MCTKRRGLSTTPHDCRPLKHQSLDEISTNLVYIIQRHIRFNLYRFESSDLRYHRVASCHGLHTKEGLKQTSAADELQSIQLTNRVHNYPVQTSSCPVSIVLLTTPSLETPHPRMTPTSQRQSNSQ